MSGGADSGGAAPVVGERVALFVAYFFPPLGGGGVQRTVKFLKYLRPLGWRGEVITVRAQEYWVADASLTADVPPDTRVWRTASWTGLSLLAGLARWRRWGRRRRPDQSAAVDRGGAPTRAAKTGGRPPAPRSTLLFRLLRWLSSCFLIPDAYIGWFPFALHAARRRLRAGGIDILLTTSSPDTAHLVGLCLRRRLAIPWVADFRDPWVRRLTFQAPTPLHRRLHVELERRVLCGADRVLVTNQATRDDFLTRHPGIPASRFAVIPNGFDLQDLTSGLATTVGDGESPMTPPIDSGPTQLRLLHAGLLSGPRTLAPMVNALAQLVAPGAGFRDRLHLTQLGPREGINDRLVDEANLGDTVSFLPPVSHAQVLRAMRDADVLVLLEHGGERGALITPGKIFEYLASCRPILALVPEGPAAALVREMRAGEVVPADDQQAIVAVLTRWLTDGPPSSGVTPELLAPYDRSALAARLATVMDELVAGRRAS